ncbi:inositol monophosphatase family protein [Enterococcus sp. HY326]|uniref:inositol monophosphatase family protein n=1 Tax=Enterococcus sp. HY326 TaxID=2971265 RepID=UPI00223FB86B|nr:inositol monophosphatase family protein [Enterococcus sp. HY326]
MTPSVKEISTWLKEAGATIKTSLTAELTIQEKSDRKDLVTNMDKATQRFLIDKIAAVDSSATFLAEEEGYSDQSIKKGRVYVIDPIDGTLNFVLEKENFCIMLAIFEEGVGQLGFIYDVMKEELYWGGPEVGVYCNDRQIKKVADLKLTEGLVGMNAYMYAHNRFNAYDIGEASMGVRVSGCAGIEMIAMLKGTHHSYVSNLSPWDYAAGIVLLSVFGFKYSNADGTPVKFSQREPFIIATPACYEDIFNLMAEKKV